jgi:hypothetical protein
MKDTGSAPDIILARIAFLNDGLPGTRPVFLDGIRYGIGLTQRYPAIAAAFSDDIDRKLSAQRKNEPLELLERRIQTIIDYIAKGEDQ